MNKKNMMVYQIIERETDETPGFRDSYEQIMGTYTNLKDAEKKYKELIDNAKANSGWCGDPSHVGTGNSYISKSYKIVGYILDNPKTISTSAYYGEGE